MINTDISQIPPPIKEVDEQETKRGRRRKKLHSALPLNRKNRRLKLDQRKGISNFSPANISSPGNIEVRIEDQSELDRESETMTQHLKPGHTFYRNPSITSVTIEEDALRASYATQKGTS